MTKQRRGRLTVKAVKGRMRAQKQRMERQRMLEKLGKRLVKARRHVVLDNRNGAYSAAYCR